MHTKRQEFKWQSRHLWDGYLDDTLGDDLARWKAAGWRIKGKKQFGQYDTVPYPRIFQGEIPYERVKDGQVEYLGNGPRWQEVAPDCHRCGAASPTSGFAPVFMERGRPKRLCWDCYDNYEVSDPVPTTDKREYKRIKQAEYRQRVRQKK